LYLVCKSVVLFVCYLLVRSLTPILSLIYIINYPRYYVNDSESSGDVYKGSKHIIYLFS